ncbi:MAG: NAD-dependent epimerase/dehydratase family protein [Ruthenibacterium lactatiformans]
MPPEADFVFHLAGVNRPQDPGEFYAGNRGFTEQLLHLAAAGNKAPVLVTSSIQAELDNDYGKTKREAEELIFAHERATGAPALVYRLPGVFGKWCRPTYNSVVATFCHNIAHGLPIEVRDPAYTFPLVYIDDVVASLHRRDGGARRAGLLHPRLLPSDVRRL